MAPVSIVTSIGHAFDTSSVDTVDKTNDAFAASLEQQTADVKNDEWPAHRGTSEEEQPETEASGQKQAHDPATGGAMTVKTAMQGADARGASAPADTTTTKQPAETSERQKMPMMASASKSGSQKASLGKKTSASSTSGSPSGKSPSKSASASIMAAVANLSFGNLPNDDRLSPDAIMQGIASAQIDPEHLRRSLESKAGDIEQIAGRNIAQAFDHSDSGNGRQDHIDDKKDDDSNTSQLAMLQEMMSSLGGFGTLDRHNNTA